MGSPAAGSADAAVEGASDADSAERPGAGEGGHRPVMQDNQLDLDIKGLLERRKALRQERQQVAKTLKKAQDTTFGTQLHVSKDVAGSSLEGFLKPRSCNDRISCVSH